MNDRHRITEDIIRLVRQDPDLALDRANDLVENMPQEVWTWSLRSYVHRVRKYYDNAFSDIDHAIEICFENPASHTQKANHLLDIHKFEAAISSYSNAIAIGEKINDSYLDELCRFKRAYCYCKIGDFETAEADLNVVDDDMRFWFDRLRTKADLLRACENRRLD
jgi:tetratricopeptide (TPR) repeat protein